MYKKQAAALENKTSRVGGLQIQLSTNYPPAHSAQYDGLFRWVAGLQPSSGLKVQELKDKLVSLGLSTAGTKTVLQERLDNNTMRNESEMTTGNNANESETTVKFSGEPVRRTMAADKSSWSEENERLNSDPILLISQDHESLNVNSTLLSVCENIKFLKSEFESFKDKYSNLPADVTKSVARKMTRKALRYHRRLLHYFRLTGRSTQNSRVTPNKVYVFWKVNKCRFHILY